MAEPVRARRLTDRKGAAAADRAAREARVGPGPAGDDHHGVGVGDTCAGDRPAGRCGRGHRARRDPSVQRRGLAALDPRWAGGRPRLISDDDIEFIVTTATTRPEKLGLPFTCWSVRKLAAYLAGSAARPVQIGRERLRQILPSRGISFQRHRTWKESRDPDKDAKLDRIEEVTSQFPGRCFAFDQFGPLSIRPVTGGPGPGAASRRLPAYLSPHPRHPLLPRLLLPGR